MTYDYMEFDGRGNVRVAGPHKSVVEEQARSATEAIQIAQFWLDAIQGDYNQRQCGSCPTVFTEEKKQDIRAAYAPGNVIYLHALFTWPKEELGEIRIRCM